jgi:4-amino-4-deoxy-L-arabinose transferase-like glycosyltransferase
MAMSVPRLDSNRMFWFAFTGLHLWKLVLAGSLDVSIDGSSYHYWALFPQLSYFDHPPLIAWAMALLRPVWDDAIWMVRFWPLVGSVVLVLTGRSLARKMFDTAAGNRAGCFLLWAPLLAGNGLLMTPDALFAPLWALAIATAWTAIGVPRLRNGWGWWVLTGCWAGLGLLAKYNMVLFWGGLGLFWLYPSGRRGQVFWGAAVAAAVAAVWFLPVVVWNAQNDWASFRFQFSHGLSDHGISRWETVPTYLGSLLLVASPLVGAFALYRGALAVASPRNEDRFLAAMAWAVLLLFGWSSFQTRVDANWPMLAFFTLLVLLGGHWTSIHPGWRKAAMGLLIGIDLVLLTYLTIPRTVPLELAGVSLEATRLREFTGGRELAAAVQQELEQRQPDFLVTDRDRLFGRISFYLPSERDRMVLLDPTADRFPWIDLDRWRGKNALWVSRQSNVDILRHTRHFRHIAEIGPREVWLRGNLTRTYYFYECTGFQPPAD